MARGKKIVLLISGTSKSIGKSLARHYAAQGHQVIGLSRTPAGINSKNYRHYLLNLSDETRVQEMFRDIDRIYGRLDVLINNAGLQSVNYALLTPWEAARNVFNTNMLGAFLLSRESAKLMRKRRFGRILNLSTAAVRLCAPGSSIYTASKAALEQFSKVFANEVAADGITVNTLGLSLVAGSGMADNLTKESQSLALNQTAFKSKITVEDILHAIDFLISKKSRAVTRQTLYLGGV